MTETQHPKRPPSHRTAQEIRAIMAARRLTQNDLAEHLGIRQQAVSRRLDGSKSLNVDEVSRIAEWLGVPYMRLLTPDALAYAS